MTRAGQRGVIVAPAVSAIANQHIAFQQQAFFQNTVVVRRQPGARGEPQQKGLKARVPIHHQHLNFRAWHQGSPLSFATADGDGGGRTGVIKRRFDGVPDRGARFYFG